MRFPTVVDLPSRSGMEWAPPLRWCCAIRCNRVRHNITANTSRTSGCWLCIKWCKWAAVCAMYEFWTRWSVLLP